MVKLISAHEKPKGHLKGIDIFIGKVVDMHKKGIIDLFYNISLFFSREINPIILIHYISGSSTEAAFYLKLASTFT